MDLRITLIMAKNYRILFADLDDTIITTKSGKKFANGIYDWKFKDGILEAIKAYNPSAVFIVTNQGGLKSAMAVDLFNYKIRTILIYLTNYLVRYKDKKKIPYTDYKFCATTDENDYDRKPNPGMINHFIELYKLDRDNCLMIGDASGKEGDFSDSDKKAAENAEIKYMDVEEFINKYKQS